MKKLFVLLMLAVLSCSKTETEILSSDRLIDRTSYTISGSVIWEHDDLTGVKDVVVTLSGTESQSTTTDVNGNYSFTVSNLGSYTLTPSKLINKTNGLSNADAIIIQQHVANVTLISDLYKRVAADCNKNGTLSTVDASIINQSLLGNPIALNYLNPSWTFIDASYTLTGPGVPTGYPTSITTTISGSSFGNDFIGVKRGDVNGSANPAN